MKLTNVRTEHKKSKKLGAGNIPTGNSFRNTSLDKSPPIWWRRAQQAHNKMRAGVCAAKTSVDMRESLGTPTLVDSSTDHQLRPGEAHITSTIAGLMRQPLRQGILPPPLRTSVADPVSRRSHCVLHCRSSLRAIPSPHGGLCSILDTSAPPAGHCFAPSFALGAELLNIALSEPHPPLLLPPGVAITADQPPKHQPPQQALLSYTCKDNREQDPRFAHRRLNAFGACLDKPVGVGSREWWTCRSSSY